MVLPKKVRIQGGLEIQRIFRKGGSLDSKSFQMKFLSNRIGFARFTVIVGLKVSKKATERNKIKRRLNEIIKLNLSKTKPGYDIILIVKPAVLDKNYKDLNDELTNNLIKIGR